MPITFHIAYPLVHRTSQKLLYFQQSSWKHHLKLKVAVLVNKSTASASEILTAALKENINAEVIGVTTYGKGKVQKTRTLSTGAMIKYTTQNWLTTKGEEIDGKGIAPTVELELYPKYYTNLKEANDNQLQKAIEMMSK